MCVCVYVYVCVRVRVYLARSPSDVATKRLTLCQDFPPHSFLLLKVRRYSISLRKFSFRCLTPFLCHFLHVLFLACRVEIIESSADSVFELRGSRITVRSIELHVLSVSLSFPMRQHGGSGISLCLLFVFSLISSVED